MCRGWEKGRQDQITESNRLNYVLSTHTHFLLNSLPQCLSKHELVVGSYTNQSNLNERLYCYNKARAMLLA